MDAGLTAASTRSRYFTSHAFEHLVVSLIDSSGSFAEGILTFTIAKP